MKPRPSLKNYQNINNNNHNNSIINNPNLPSLQRPQQQLQTHSSSLRDFDLAKVTSNQSDDMPNLQAPSQSSNKLNNPEEIIKCLQAIYGKNSTDILPNIPQMSDWPTQSVSPPELKNSGGGVNNLQSCFNANNNNNNINNLGNNPGHHSQDIKFNTSANNQQLSHQQHTSHKSSAATAIANHHFRVSSSNIHSPQQHLLQQKSVLSLHQQHQNDLSNNRRLNYPNHHLSTTNASFTNLNNIANLSNATSPDSNKMSISGNCKNTGTSSANIIDTISSMDNMFYDNSLPTNKDMSSTSSSLLSSSTNQQPQSFTKHKQLQKLLEAKSSLKPSISSSISSSTTLSHRNDQHRNNLNSNYMSQLPMSSQAPNISPQAPAFSSIPKSLLNLAACSSSSPNSTSGSLREPSQVSTASKFSSMVRQLNLRTSRNGPITAGNNSNLNINNTRATLKTNAAGNNMDDVLYSNQKGYASSDPYNSMLQQMTRSATTNSANNAYSNNINNNVGISTRSSLKHLQVSLLSEDQQTQNVRSNNNMKACIANSTTDTPSSKVPIQAQRSNMPSTSKEAYLASLQERAARAGVSIGEINKPIQKSNNNNSMNVNDISGSLLQQKNYTMNISLNQPKDDFANEVSDRKEIESALSRVEARNDLSLLYPPLLLAPNSQKQINALSAGLQNNEDSELFTQEVKKIVLEECNIIYECKECNNLFRSLANLVKHKRMFCPDKTSDRNNIEMNKRLYASTMLPQPVKRPAPKRKLLEDCIQKVKRDRKLISDDNEDDFVQLDTNAPESNAANTPEVSIKVESPEVVQEIESSVENELPPNTDDVETKTQDEVKSSQASPGPSTVASSKSSSSSSNSSPSNSPRPSSSSGSNESSPEHEQPADEEMEEPELEVDEADDDDAEEEPLEIDDEAEVEEEEEEDAEDEEEEERDVERKQEIQAPASTSAVNTSSASTSSANSAGASGNAGGVMKFKIQLKTRPDEKSKVYEIV